MTKNNQMPERILAHQGMTPDAGGWRKHKLYMTDQTEYIRADTIAAKDRELVVAQEALHKIGCFGDKLANKQLEFTGSYRAFDEPSSVRIAREAIDQIEAVRKCPQ